jgi:hypothetical protein
MKFDFLKDFDKRMKKVGMFTLINYNSFFKNTLKNYGFDVPYESTNLIFAMLIFIMEQSLKEEDCTLDHMAQFIEDIDREYFNRNLKMEDCKIIADFIVNTVMCNNGETMYFKGYNFESSEYEDVNIALINNKAVEIDGVRRTSYYLSEDGYYLLLSTLEVESNLKLTVQEMIFDLHLKKADYDKAIEDVKQLFNLSRIQLQKIEESIRTIKENVFSFSSEEYDKILRDNMGIIETQNKSFKGYRDYVTEKENDILENNIQIYRLDEEDYKALVNLGIIKKQLSRVIDEHQRILNSHFDFKKTYSDALTGMTAFSAIKRINMNKDLYEPILKDFSKLEALPVILRALFFQSAPQYYNLQKCIQSQRVINAKEEIDEIAITFDEESLREEREREIKIKNLKYRGIVEILLDKLMGKEEYEITLEEIVVSIGVTETLKSCFIPSIEIFREVMIELLKANYINIDNLLDEMKASVSEEGMTAFRLNNTILSLVTEQKRFKKIRHIEIKRDFTGKELKIVGAMDDNGYAKTVRCSNIIFKART